MSNSVNLKIFRLSFPELKLSARDGHKIRGYLAKMFSEHNVFHNHDDSGWLYRYPLVQYKVINGVPFIIGINEGAEKLLQVEDDLKELVLEGREIPLFEKALTFSHETIEVLNDVVEYSFATPWMALNQENYRQFQKTSGEEQREKLRSILIGNLLSFSKGLNYRVSDKITVDIGKLKSIETKFKNQKMLAFAGNFFVNFAIPDYLGIGKSVSRGFGTVCRVK